VRPPEFGGAGWQRGVRAPARALTGIVGAILLLAAGCAPGTGEGRRQPSGGAGAGQSAEVVRLTVAPSRDRPRYVREDWQPHGWADDDGDGCNTREEVLIAESRSPVQRHGRCKVLSGDWLDPYTGLTTTSPSDLQVDHLVALADAHRSGGWAWPAAKKMAFANDLSDPELLNAVSGDENERKADDGPDRWLPPNRAYRCSYVSAYARIKAKWSLTVTPDQNAALARALKECPSNTAG
jgi:hypothetical protein